jgi:L-malate glycosyltransferase
MSTISHEFDSDSKIKASNLPDALHGRRGLDKPVPVLLMVAELGIGGCERDLTKIALGLDRRRFEPHIACLSPEGLRSRELRAAGVPILALPTRSLVSRSALAGAKLLAQYVRRHRIQIAHAYDGRMDIIALPVCWLSGVPTIIKSHLWYRTMTQDPYQFLHLISDRMVDAIVTNSEAVRQDLIQKYRVSARKTFLCYNGVDTKIFSPHSGEPRVAVIQDASLVIGCVCAIRPEKRLDLLMKAFLRVRPLCPDMKLLLVGSGPFKPEIERLRAELGLASVCHLEPSHEDVSIWMRSIDIFVQASDTESFPNALLEAMACGCCVIASRVGGIPELVTDHEDGLLFTPGNLDDLSQKLTEVIESKELRLALASKAAETAAERFPIGKTVSRTESLYESVLKRR